MLETTKQMFLESKSIRIANMGAVTTVLGLSKGVQGGTVGAEEERGLQMLGVTFCLQLPLS